MSNSYANPTNKQLDAQLWMVGSLPLKNTTFLTKTQVREYLDTHCGGTLTAPTKLGPDECGPLLPKTAKSFAVVYIDGQGKQQRKYCCALTVGRYGRGCGSVIDPWAKGDNCCIVADRESPKGTSSCWDWRIIEFNMNMVIGIVTCERFNQLCQRQRDIDCPEIDDADLQGAPPPMIYDNFVEHEGQTYFYDPTTGEIYGAFWRPMGKKVNGKIILY